MHLKTGVPDAAGQAGVNREPARYRCQPAPPTVFVIAPRSTTNHGWHRTLLVRKHGQDSVWTPQQRVDQADGIYVDFALGSAEPSLASALSLTPPVALAALDDFAGRNDLTRSDTAACFVNNEAQHTFESDQTSQQPSSPSVANRRSVDTVRRP